jgi:diguanylate cyclase (GGDEF)-like protein
VVTEQTLPDMDASVLREKCIVQPRIRDIPFLFLVEGGKTELQVRALRSGVDDCVVTPVDPMVLAARVEAVIQRREAYDRLVRIDPLTRLLNRLTLESEVNQELQRLSRYHRIATMVLLDVDDFDRVNDTKGFSMGDLLLTCLAGLILSSIRAVDVAGRHRGEKFLVFLPETDLEGAQIFTKRIQQQLAAIATSVAEEPLTFSAGIVCAPKDGETFGVLSERAYAAMRVAKQDKPGSFVVWKEGIVSPEH